MPVQSPLQRSLPGLAHIPTKHTLDSPGIYPHGVLLFSIRWCVSCLYPVKLFLWEQMDCVHPTSIVGSTQVEGRRAKLELQEIAKRKKKRKQKKNLLIMRGKRQLPEEKRKNSMGVKSLPLFEYFHGC